MGAVRGHALARLYVLQRPFRVWNSIHYALATIPHALLPVTVCRITQLVPLPIAPVDRLGEVVLLQRHSRRLGEKRDLRRGRCRCCCLDRQRHQTQLIRHGRLVRRGECEKIPMQFSGFAFGCSIAAPSFASGFRSAIIASTSST